MKTLTKKLGQITDSSNFDARGTGQSGLSEVAVTELLCSQVCFVRLVMFLSVFILIVFQMMQFDGRYVLSNCSESEGKVEPWRQL
jgi:hypothetical protein